MVYYPVLSLGRRLQSASGSSTINGQSFVRPTTGAGSRQYSSFRFINHRKLQKLETEAMANPKDAAAQSEFYKVLLRTVSTTGVLGFDAASRKESRANIVFPHYTNHSTHLLQELLRIDDYTGIISRFESGKFASSEASLQYYAIALARTNQAEQIVPKIMQRLQRQPLPTESEAMINTIGQGVRRANPMPLAENAIANGGALAAESLANAGNKGNPIYVVMDDSKSKPTENAPSSVFNVFSEILTRI